MKQKLDIALFIYGNCLSESPLNFTSFPYWIFDCLYSKG